MVTGLHSDRILVPLKEYTSSEQYNARTYNIPISLLRPRPQPGAYIFFFTHVMRGLKRGDGI